MHFFLSNHTLYMELNALIWVQLNNLLAPHICINILMTQTFFTRHANIPQENGWILFNGGKIDFKFLTESTDHEQSVEYNKSSGTFTAPLSEVLKVWRFY